jgi:hypothetical protein
MIEIWHYAMEEYKTPSVKTCQLALRGEDVSMRYLTIVRQLLLAGF